MTRYVVTVRNKNGNAPIGFDGVWLDALDEATARAVALDGASESTGITIDQLVCSVSPKDQQAKGERDE